MLREYRVFDLERQKATAEFFFFARAFADGISLWLQFLTHILILTMRICADRPGVWMENYLRASFFPNQLSVFCFFFPTPAGGSSTPPSSSLGPDRASLSTVETCTSAAWIKRKMWESISAWRQTLLALLWAERRASTLHVSPQLLCLHRKIHELHIKKKTTCRGLLCQYPVAHWCWCRQIYCLFLSTNGQFSRSCQTFPYFWPPAIVKWPSATNGFIFSYRAACLWKRSPLFIYPCSQVCFLLLFMITFPSVFHKCIHCRLCLVWCWDRGQSHCW